MNIKEKEVNGKKIKLHKFYMNPKVINGDVKFLPLCKIINNKSGLEILINLIDEVDTNIINVDISEKS